MTLTRSRSAVVALLTLAAATMAAVPTNQKFKDWMPEGTGLLAYEAGGNPQVDGMAMVRVGSNNLSEINLVVHNLQPNVQYAVMLTRDGISVWNDVQAFTTNSKGKGMYDSMTFDEGGLNTLPAVIRIYKWDGNFDPLLPGVPDDVITEDEARAVALPS